MSKAAQPLSPGARAYVYSVAALGVPIAAYCVFTLVRAPVPKEFVAFAALTLLSGAFGLVGGWGLCRLINMLPMPARFQGMIITPATGAIAAGALTILVTATDAGVAQR